MADLALASDYPALLSDLKAQIRTAQTRVVCSSVLPHQIDSRLMERQRQPTTNFDRAWSAPRRRNWEDLAVRIKMSALTCQGMNDTIISSSSRRASAYKRTSAAHFFGSRGLC